MNPATLPVVAVAAAAGIVVVVVVAAAVAAVAAGGAGAVVVVVEDIVVVVVAVVTAAAKASVSEAVATRIQTMKMREWTWPNCLRTVAAWGILMNSSLLTTTLELSTKSWLLSLMMMTTSPYYRCC